MQLGYLLNQRWGGGGDRRRAGEEEGSDTTGSGGAAAYLAITPLTMGGQWHKGKRAVAQREEGSGAKGKNRE
ncbi:unnamed protein product, partial [Ilex paraguariensis]